MIKKVIARVATTATLWAVPAFVFATSHEGSAASQDYTPITKLVQTIGDIIAMLIPIAIAAAILFFIWGLAQYILKSGDDKEKAIGKNRMIMGILAIFVMVSVLGIVRLLARILNVDDKEGVTPPCVRGVNCPR